MIDRSGPAVRAALAQHAPADCARFERELRNAVRQAQTDLDLSCIDVVLRRGHTRAVIAANPIEPHELAQIERARAGDVAGLRERRDDGTWVTL